MGKLVYFMFYKQSLSSASHGFKLLYLVWAFRTTRVVLIVIKTSLWRPLGHTWWPLAHDRSLLAPHHRKEATPPARNRLGQHVADLSGGTREGRTHRSPLEGVAAGSRQGPDESGWWGGRCLWVTWSADYSSTPISSRREEENRVLTVGSKRTKWTSFMVWVE